MQAEHRKLTTMYTYYSPLFYQVYRRDKFTIRVYIMHFNSTEHLINVRNLQYTFSKAYSYWGPLIYGRLRIGRVSLYHRGRNRRGHVKFMI